MDLTGRDHLPIHLRDKQNLKINPKIKDIVIANNWDGMNVSR